MTAKVAQEFTKDWFSHNIATWEKIFAEHKGKEGLRYLEIGAFEGRSASWLLSNILTDPSCTIECADLFTATEHGDYYPTFLKNIAPWHDRVVVHSGPSFDTLSRIRNDFDAIYVDGWHSAYGVLADAVMSWPRLKVGGLMVFDDYLWIPEELKARKKPNLVQHVVGPLRGHSPRAWARRRIIEDFPSECPKAGVDGFLATVDGYYDIVSSGYQLAIRKTRNFGQVL
jgi:predicted O-methyltransferase YrrM